MLARKAGLAALLLIAGFLVGGAYGVAFMAFTAASYVTSARSSTS